MMKNRCVAHRGWSGSAPENTQAAFRKAISDPRIDMIELDVQLTRDLVPVVIHDYTLERTTNGKGFVGAHTLQELQQLDAGSWFALEFAGERIPTLEEVLQLVKGKLQVNIEIKRAGDWYPDIVQQVVKQVHQCEMTSDVIITSFHHASIREVSRLDAEIRTGLIFYGMPEKIDEQLKHTGATALSICYPYLTRGFVARYLEQGIDIIAWTIDNKVDMQRTAALDERIAICTNHPDRWFQLGDETREGGLK